MIAEPLARSAATRAILVVVALSFFFGRAAQSQEPEVVEFIEISGLIDPPVAGYLERKIDEANSKGSAALIIRLDSSGAMGVSVSKLIGKMTSSEVPIVVWVAPAGARARGAGFFLLVASDVAVMSPGTSIGPPFPVNLGAGAYQPATGDRGFVQAVAASRGRDPEPALRAVLESRPITAEDAADRGIVDLVSGQRTLLDDLDNRPLPRLAPDWRLNTEGATLRFHTMSVWERVLHAAVDPEVAYFLLLFGFFGLIFELYHPGIGAAGLLGGGALALGLYALTVLPASWWAAALLVGAVALYSRDLHTRSFGVFTVAGSAALVASGFWLFDRSLEELSLSIWAVVTSLPVTLLFFVSIMTAAIRARLARPASPQALGPSTRRSP